MFISNWAGCYTFINPVLQKLSEAERLTVQSQPGLHGETLSQDQTKPNQPPQQTNKQNPKHLFLKFHQLTHLKIVSELCDLGNKSRGWHGSELLHDSAFLRFPHFVFLSLLFTTHTLSCGHRNFTHPGCAVCAHSSVSLLFP